MASKTATCISKSHNSNRTCLCSPTSHPGSFRCSLHRNSNKQQSIISNPAFVVKPNSIKGCLLLQLIKPSSHDLQRRRQFQPKPTRFCLMNDTRNQVAVS
ncbi:hypothetical protein CerSpe_265200 [Prunus speciosa]